MKTEIPTIKEVFIYLLYADNAPLLLRIVYAINVLFVFYYLPFLLLYWGFLRWTFVSMYYNWKLNGNPFDTAMFYSGENFFANLEPVDRFVSLPITLFTDTLTYFIGPDWWQIAIFIFVTAGFLCLALIIPFALFKFCRWLVQK